MFLSHPMWVGSVRVIPVSHSLMIIDGTVSAVFDSLYTADGFHRLGSMAPNSPAVVPTHWMSSCNIDNKPVRPVQCRINDKCEIEIFLSFKNFRSITVFFDSVLVEIGNHVSPNDVHLDHTIACKTVGPIFKLSGSIPAPVFWESPNSEVYQLNTKLPQNFRPDSDLAIPVLSSSNWFVCKIFSDGRIIVQLAHPNVCIRTDTPVPLDSVWWVTGEGGMVSSSEFRAEKIHLINSRQQPLSVAPGKSICFFALNGMESTSTNSICPGAPENLVQLTLSPEGVIAPENVMVSTTIVFGIDNPKPVIDSSIWLSRWQSTLSVSDFNSISQSIGEGVEQYAKGLSDLAGGRLNVAQLRSMVIDKKLSTIKIGGGAEDNRKTCAWIRASSRALAPGQRGVISDHVACTLVEAWGLTSVLEKVKKFLSSKVPEMDFEDEQLMGMRSVASIPAPTLDLDQYRPPPPLGGWMISGRKCSHQIRLAKNALPDELDTLYRIINWFHQWSSSDSELTHSSFLGNQDIFTNTGKWKIPDDPEIQNTLFKHMSWIYKRGYDTFISEIQTPVFPLIEDIDCESTIPMSDTTLIDEIFLSDRFIAERARALKIIYPNITEFKCYMYSSSGFNKSKNRWKSSFHLVWPDLIVDGRLAPIIRQTAVEYFLYKTNACNFFKRMQYRLMNHYDANIWENVFDQTTSNCMNGLRMPYSNKASWVKTNGNSMKYPRVEDRHCFPRGTVMIEFENEISDTTGSLGTQRLIEAEKEAFLIPMKDQNEIIHDRTQYKSVDKNTINRTSAFFKAMRAIGGDTVADLHVTVKWTETVADAEDLPDEEIQEWIKRGSCRMATSKMSQLTPYNEVFVEEFETADLEIFEGHTLESLRRTDIWAKMTPAAQAGIKTRFRKYLLKKAGKKTTTTVAEQRAKIQQDNDEIESLEDIVEEDPEDVQPPVNDEEEIFYEKPLQSEYIWKYGGTLIEFERELRCALKCSNSEGYWVHTQTSVSWTSERDRSANGWGSFLDVYSTDQRTGTPPVKVSFHYHCGKVIIAGNQASKVYMLVLRAVKSFTEPDDGLYHKLNLPHLSEESFALLDEDELLLQREEYEKRWLCMKNVDLGI